MNEYKTIPFAEVKIGQEFDRPKGNLCNPWIKENNKTFSYRGNRSALCPFHTFPKGCLVRTADCEPTARPLPLPLTVRGEGSDSWLQDAKGRAVVPRTQGLSDDEHVKFLNWIAAKGNS